MKHVVSIVSFMLLTFMPVMSQVQDFKTKNSGNQAQRTQMLDALRGEVKKLIRQEVVFVVDHFKVSGDYAWFEGSVQRKDGGEIQLNDEDFDCCKATCLFVKRGAKWSIAEYGAFGRDVWWSGIGQRFPRAPRAIFPEYGSHYE